MFLSVFQEPGRKNHEELDQDRNKPLGKELGTRMEDGPKGFKRYKIGTRYYTVRGLYGTRTLVNEYD